MRPLRFLLTGCGIALALPFVFGSCTEASTGSDDDDSGSASSTGVGGATTSGMGGSATTGMGGAGPTTTTGMGGTGPTTSSVTGAGGSGGDCNVNDCATCVNSSCAMTSCAGPLATCNANPDCASLVACALGCTTQACVQNCALTYPGGINDATALQTCACAMSVCGMDCAGSLCL